MNRLLPCIVVAASLAGATFVLAQADKDEVLYKGKPASFWMRQLKDRDVSYRLDAIKALKEIGTDGEGVAVALIGALADKDQAVKDAAIEALASLPVGARVDGLVVVLRKKDKALRPVLIELLGAIGPRAGDALAELTTALDDEDAVVRAKAARALSKIGVPDKLAVAALARLLDDKEPAVRLEAIGALAQLKSDNDKVLSAIILACTGPDEAVRKEARAIFGRAQMARRVAVLVPALKSKEKEVRAFALDQLEGLGPSALPAVTALTALLDDKSDRLAAARALGAIGESASAAILALTRLLDDEDKDVYAAALAALRKMGLSAKVPALIGSLRDAEPTTRQRAAKELGELGVGAKSAIPALARALHDPSLEVCYEAASALKAMGKDAVPPLVEFVKSKGRGREAAIRALGEIGPAAKVAVPELGKLLDDPDGAVQVAAATALRSLGSDNALQLCLACLKVADLPVRIKAARDLAAMGAGAKTALPALARAAVSGLDEGRDGWQLYDAYLALVQALGKDAIPPLVEALKRHAGREPIPDQLVAGLIVLSLAELDVPDPSEVTSVLRKLLDDGSCSVPAALALGQMGGARARVAVPALLSIVAGEYDLRAVEHLLEARSRAERMARRHREDEEVRRQGKEPLTRFDEIKRVEDVAERNKQTRRMAAAALRNMGKDALAPLIDVFKLGGPAGSYAAIALARLGPDARAAVPVLVERLEDKEFRLAAAYALGKIGGPGARAAVPVLVTLLADSDEVVQRNVAASFRNLGKEAVPELIKLLKDNPLYVVAGALAEIGPDASDAAGPLAFLLENDFNHDAAALALGRIGRADAGPALPTLIKLLDDEDRQRRIAAALALGGAGKVAAGPLLDYLKRERSHRDLAAFALGQIGAQGQDAIPALVRLLKDENREVQLAAATALGKLGKEAVPALIEVVKGKDDREPLAAYALGAIGPDARPAVALLVDLLEDSRRTGLDAKKAGEAKAPTERRPVFLHPDLRKVSTCDPVLLSGVAVGQLAAIALANIGGPGSEAAIPVLKNALSEKELARDAKGEAFAKGEKDQTRIARMVRAFEPADDTDDRELRSRPDALGPLFLAKALARLAPKEVVSLKLSHATLTDAEIREIGELKSLSKLNLSFARIPEAGLEELARLTHLSSLDLRGTQISEAGLKKLRKALPRTRIQQ